jgi:hypothetical protein
MESVRIGFGKWVNRIKGGSSKNDSTLANSGDDFKKLSDLVYFFILALAVISTVSALLFFDGSFKTQLCLGILWGLVVGGCLVFYLPPKYVTTGVGGVLGLSSTEVTGVSTILERLIAESVTITETMTTIISDGSKIYTIPILIFSVIVLGCCVPAYKKEWVLKE